MASQPAPRIRLSRASTSVSEEEQQIYHERSEVSATEEDLWQALTPEHLVMLRRYFIQPRGWSGRGSLSIAGEDETEYRNLTRPQFIDAVTTLLDTEKFEGVCGAIFDAIIAAMTPSLPSTTTTTTTTSSSGLTGGPISSSSSNISTSSSSVGGSTLTLGISWRGLVTYLAEGVSGLCEASPPDPLFSPSVKYTLLTQNKREGVSNVVLCGRKKVLIVGSRGSLTKTVHRSRQQYQSRLLLDVSPADQQQATSSYRKTNLGTWIVEVSMIEEEMAVMAASSSTLHFVDTSNSVPQEILRITHLPALPTCIAAGFMNDGRWVSIGDDTGSVHLIRISHPIITLLTRSRNEGLTCITWQEMCNGLKEINGRMVEVCVGVRVVSIPNVHSGSIRQITYHPPYASLVSCSSDPKAGLVIRGPDHAMKTYTFVIPKGVRVFAAEWYLHVIVTGSSDGRLRVWNPYVPEAPLAVLPPSPSRAPPAAVLIWSLKRTILTCDTDAVVRIYGLEGSRCIHTVKLNFPGGSTGLAPRPLTLLPSGHLIIACRDYLATLTPAPRPLSAPQQIHTSEMSRSQSDLSSDGESDQGFQDTDDDQNKNDRSVQESDEENESNIDNINNSTPLSTEDRRESQRIRHLIRQGATFCCLKLPDVSPPTLPPDLPLPARLANLGLSPSDPIALLTHLPVTTQTISVTPRSAPASARSPSSRHTTPTPQTKARPKSGRRAPIPKSPRAISATTGQYEVLGSRRHLSPGWRPQKPETK